MPARLAILCNHYDMDMIAEKVANHLDDYNSFVFDGSRLYPQYVITYAIKPTPGLWEKIMINCCLPHCLQYAVGHSYQKWADRKFYYNLVACGLHPSFARVMLRHIRLRARLKLQTSLAWGFACKLQDRTTKKGGCQQ